MTKISSNLNADWNAFLDDALQFSGLNAHLQLDCPEAWRHVWNDLPYQPVSCKQLMLEYQHNYFSSAGWLVQDISLVLFNDGKPVGLWPLMLAYFRGKTTLTTSGTTVLPPILLPNISGKTDKTINAKALEFLLRLCHNLPIPVPILQWPVLPEASHLGLSEWQQRLMQHGVLPNNCYELFVNLHSDISEIRSNFRKSYKSLINRGLEIFYYEVLDKEKITIDIWEEFKKLHFDVSGRSTRNDSTWRCQYEMIGAGTAFLVTVRDRETQRMVGGGFFQHTRDEGLYAVAAYDRSLFDMPIGHAVQQLAIEKMKSLGLKWYRIGERRYAQEMPPPSPKEIAIGEFKHGFASHEFVRQEYRWPIISRKDAQ